MADHATRWRPYRPCRPDRPYPEEPKHVQRDLCRWRGPLLLLCLLLAGVAGTEPLDRYQGFEVNELKLEGLPEGAPAGWAGGLALKPRRQLLGWKKASFSSRLLADDTHRLQLQLARIGYPRARIVPRVEEVDAEERSLDLILSIQPGVPVLLADYRVQGWPGRLAAADSTWQDEMVPGRRFSDKLVARTERRLETRLMDSGYEMARVRSLVRLLDRGPGPGGVRSGPGALQPDR